MALWIPELLCFSRRDFLRQPARRERDALRRRETGQVPIWISDQGARQK